MPPSSAAAAAESPMPRAAPNVPGARGIRPTHPQVARITAGSVQGTRAVALARMTTALDEVVVDGILTNIPLHRDLVRDAAFAAGGTDIHYLERKLALD